jgi:hypothetical protein
MPIDEHQRMTIASVRNLRFALGTSLSLWFSQAVGWPLSFVAPVFTSVILAMPAPALPLKGGLGLVLVLLVSLNAGTLLLPTLLNQPAVGILLLVIALFWSFYFTAKGGSPALGTFATLGIALSTAIGSVNVSAVLELIGYMGFAACAGVLFVWLAHGLLPDSMAAPFEKPAPQQQSKVTTPDLERARWSAFRSLLIVLPIALWLLISAGSASYLAVMLKVASMGQQTTNEDTGKAGRSLLLSTVIGGVGAIIGWQVLSIAPTLTMYTLFVAIAALLMGRRIYKGTAAHPDSEVWSYGFLTMLIILAPAVLDSAGGDTAGLKFWQRLVMFGGATLYAIVAVYIVDAFRPRNLRSTSTAESTASAGSAS